MQITKKNLPDFLTSGLDRFYEPLEIDLLQILANKPLEKTDSKASGKEQNPERL